MAATGFSPSGRLFEAAACGVPIVTDDWPGLSEFFEAGDEILVAGTPAEARGALERGDGELRRIARAARERTLAAHTAACRARELETIFERSARGVGHHSGGRRGNADSAAGVLEGTAAGGEPARRIR
jgi:spore maturation protein CgeB